MKNNTPSKRSSLLLRLCICSLLLVQASLRAAEPTEAEIKALIEQLASTNERPRAYPEVAEGPDAVYPKNFNEEAQQKVWQAYRALKNLGPKAYPLLNAYRIDKRYSLTEDTGNVEENINVGFLCNWILRHQISPFNEYVVGKGYTTGRAVYDNVVVGPRGDRPTCPSFYPTQTDAKWFKDHQNASLHSIQVETIKWMIAEEEKDPNTYDDEERAELKRILAELEKTKKPLVSKRSFIAK